MVEVVRLLLRLPKDVWEELRDWAAQEDRSLNAQIVHVLRRALAERKGQ